MTTSQHTPGPWIKYELAHSPATQLLARWRVGTPNFCVAGMALSGDSRIDEANARLIAAAPDLLAALQQIVEGAEGSPTHGSLAFIARAAIAKATGA